MAVNTEGPAQVEAGTRLNKSDARRDFSYVRWAIRKAEGAIATRGQLTEANADRATDALDEAAGILAGLARIIEEGAR